ncbi:TetR family transcriptional regulator [Saccharopolyspora sp. NPDC000995]
MDTISKESGVSKPTLYSHFRAKSESGTRRGGGRPSRNWPPKQAWREPPESGERDRYSRSVRFGDLPAGARGRWS